jgi:Tol biopolymer transport system component
MVDDETGNSAVYVIKDDGTGLRQMTPDGRSAHSPSWSPDHSRMTFCGDLDDPGNMDIYITDIAGQTFERITVETGIDCGPSWSPDGGSILYWHSNDDGDWTTRLFEIADGRRSRRVSRDTCWAVPDPSRLSHGRQQEIGSR